jgi:hypothetical protein
MADLNLVPLHVVPAIEIPLISASCPRKTAWDSIEHRRRRHQLYITYTSNSLQRAIQTALTDTRDTSK